MAKSSLATTSLSGSKPGGAVTTLPQAPAVVSVGSAFSQTPYTQFAHPMSPTWSRVCAAIPGIEESDPVLMLPEPARPIKLDPMRFMLFTGFQFWGKFSGDGKDLLMARTDKPETSECKGKDGWKEQIESVLFVFANGKLYPASTNFRTTKCNAFHVANAALALASKPEEWGAVSADHKLTIGFPEPWSRFVATVKLKKNPAKPGGNPFVTATSLIHPTGAADATIIAAAFADEGFHKTFNAVLARYEDRVREAMAKVK